MGLFERWRRKRAARALRQRLADHAYQRQRVDSRRQESGGRSAAGGPVRGAEAGRDEAIDLEGGPVWLDAATNLLRFPAGWERQYERHLALVGRLKERGAYPALLVFGLEKISPHASCWRLIVVTGPTPEAARLPDIFRTPEAEDFVARECAGDWSAVNPASSLTNLPDPGFSVDLAPFDALLDELRAGFYRKEREV